MLNLDRHSPATGEVYHVFTKSIAGFRIFNDPDEFSRIKEITRYYQQKDLPLKFSRYKQLREASAMPADLVSRESLIVDIIAYCFMPTHIHFVLKQLEDNGISLYMNNVLNSYTRYFNIRHKRKGPLWEGRFKKVRVVNDEQLLHLTRYVHLNPVTADLINKPERWVFSSYCEYLNLASDKDKITSFENVLNVTPRDYKEFVEERKDYQQELKKIKDMIFD